MGNTKYRGAQKKVRRYTDQGYSTTQMILRYQRCCLTTRNFLPSVFTQFRHLIKWFPVAPQIAWQIFSHPFQMPFIFNSEQRPKIV